MSVLFNVQCSESQIIENLNILAKTVGSPYNCREPWLQKLRQPVRLEPRFVTCDLDTPSPLLISALLTPGNCCWRGTKGCPGLERGLRDHCGELLSDAITLSPSKREIVSEILHSPAARILFSRLSTLSARRRTTRLSSRCPLTLLVTWWAGGKIRPPRPLPLTLPALFPQLRERKSLSEGNKQRSRVENSYY